MSKFHGIIAGINSLDTVGHSRTKY